jgi:hypothetical protein
MYCTYDRQKITARFIAIEKAEVLKRQYSSKAKSSNVGEGGSTVKPARARAASERCMDKIYGNLRKPARERRARAMH